MAKTPKIVTREAARVFTPTTPIDELSLFSGRANQVEAVLRAINQRGQHAILFGERGVGKTSLANVLSQLLHSSDKVVLAPRINCDSIDTFESVWTKTFDEITMHRNMKAAGFKPEAKTADFISTELLGNTINPESVRRALTIITQHALPILIIDEFDRLEDEVKRGIADTIKTLSDHAVNATIILVGVADSVDNLIEQHESVERALVQVRMPRMSEEEIRGIIDGGLQKLQLAIEGAALQHLCTLAQGLPHYAHLLGLESATIAIQTGHEIISAAILRTAINNALARSQQSIKSGWYRATSSQRKDNLFADVLLACALAEADELGYFAPQDVKEPLSKVLNRRVEIANYAQHLGEFCDGKRGPILQRVGEKRRYRFRFINPLMQPYIVMQGYATGKISDDILVGSAKAYGIQSDSASN